ncbi:MAG: OmpH family outer membrane protein [Bacteroidia bacterium]|nr:MAG: OmpH family outer membrane protein [Bacteroidia bacterium]
MKRFIGFFALVVMVTFMEQNALAQNLKFGHINRTELIQAMPEFDSARVTLEKLNTELSNTAELLQVELNNKYETYLKESKNLTDLVRQTKEQELNDAQKRLTDFQSNAQNSLQEKQVALFTPITEKADKAIKEVGKENGFIYIFDLSQGVVAYFDESKSTNVMTLTRTKLGLK